MPQYIALKTFLGRFGTMHRGMTYTLPEGYARDLMHNQLVRPMHLHRAPLNAAITEAPAILGEDTAGLQADGKGQPSSASPQGQASQRRMLTTRNRGPK